MTDLGLQTQAKIHFGFLVSECGYRCVASSSSQVRFESPSTFIEIRFDGGRSFELGLLVGKVTWEDEPFTIGEILRLCGAPEAVRFSLVQVTNRDALARWVAKLSEVLRVYGDELIGGDEVRFAALARQRHEDVKGYALERALEAARTEVEVAWRNGDYATVVRALKPLGSFLTASEIKKMKIAERRIFPSPE